MASLESVAAKAKARTEAHQALITEARNAVTAGIPKAAVARAAGVTRQTIINWTTEANRDTHPD